MDLIPNACGARLVYGLVEFEHRAPCEPHVTLSEYPILGFLHDADRLIPVTMNGPWRGGEWKVSVVGAFIWAVTDGRGVELPDGTRCPSVAHFERYAIAAIGALVRKVRKEKGWSEDRLPAIKDRAELNAIRTTARRMYVQALARLNDSDVTAQSLRTQSDSQSLLRILAFEVLLKCALRLCDVEPYKTHNYAVLWDMLQPEHQAEILRSAAERTPGQGELSNVDGLLHAYQHVFERGRYYYELLEGQTEDEARQRDQEWEARGAPADEADVRYYPAELDSLITGLRAFIEARMPELMAEHQAR